MGRCTSTGYFIVWAFITALCFVVTCLVPIRVTGYALYVLILVAFKIYDMDKDGYISNGELFQVLKMMVGSNLKDAQLQQIVDKTIIHADSDGDGKISFEEFCSVSFLFYLSYVRGGIVVVLFSVSIKCTVLIKSMSYVQKFAKVNLKEKVIVQFMVESHVSMDTERSLLQSVRQIQKHL